MAAASYMNLYFSNGQQLNVLIGASAAIGTNPYVNFDGVATSGNTTEFTPRSDCRLIDQINTGGAATAGQCELYNVTRGVRTGRFLDNITASYAVTVPKRVIPQVALKGGHTYRFIQSIAQVS